MVPNPTSFKYPSINEPFCLLVRGLVVLFVYVFTMASEPEDRVEEIDPCKLIRKDGVLGFERAKEFEAVTNFDIEVSGYVGHEGHITGYIINLRLAVTDPLELVPDNSK